MKKLKIIFTSDTHGHLFPENYTAKCKEDSGLLNIAHQIEKDGNTLVLDGGDTLQGTPLSQYYISRRRSYPFQPLAEGFNAMGCDYFTLGNHDFNFGYEVLKEYINAMNATCLCANLTDLRGELKVKPHAIRVLENGLRIGLTGIVTDYVNIWEQEKNLSELKITDAFEAAQCEYEALRGKCDVCVCIYHGGFEEDLETGERLTQSRENVACEIARKLGYDFLLTGHQHIAMAGKNLHRTYAVQPPANAGKYIRLEAVYEKAEAVGTAGHEECDAAEGETLDAGKDKGNSEKGISAKEEEKYDAKNEESCEEIKEETDLDLEETRLWRPKSIFSEVIKVGNEHDLQPFQKLLPLEHDVQAWLDAPVGTLAKEIPAEEKLDAALHGSQMADFFNQIQLEETGADFSCTSLGNIPVGLPHEVTMRDICNAYLFPNTLFVLEVDEAVLRTALERCASYFAVEDGAVWVSDEFLRPKVEHYNYDFYSGIRYTFDVRKPVGSRVVSLTKADGTPLGDKKYRLVMNNYRASGTGGYQIFETCPVLWCGEKEMPELIADYIRKNSPVEVKQQKTAALEVMLTEIKFGEELKN
ncbi:MAG: bifunctional UDP-sugar hydrolase/5'-nucleotidase [Lachnospiraceae bacterium]|nr:bifunctional UDP-sugar hydrolase/5'-nucleotidase [Lachnospiraceae bacterium]